MKISNHQRKITRQRYKFKPLLLQIIMVKFDFVSLFTKVPVDKITKQKIVVNRIENNVNRNELILKWLVPPFFSNLFREDFETIFSYSYKNLCVMANKSLMSI